MRLAAAWVVPVEGPPVRNGWVAVRDGRIAAVGAGDDPEARAWGPRRDLGSVVLVPGLVNAHVHFELSWLRGQVSPAGEFTAWVKQLLAARGGVERPDDPRVVEAAAAAASEARALGTVAVGDISNSLMSVAPIEQAGLSGIVFHELLGFRETDGALVARTREARAEAGRQCRRVRVAVAPHAPYSVSAELFRAIRDEAGATGAPAISVHVGESPAEMQLLNDGTGEWARMLRAMGAWREDWRPPATGPVEYLDELGLIGPTTLVVHGVQLADESLTRLAARGATLVTCPRSNQWVGVGAPPAERFYASGATVAVGTDSLASVADLNLFEELRTLRRLAPGVPARRLIESATLAGARALGLGDELGSLVPGKRADIVAVSLPPDVEDVEEHLVRGITQRDIAWAWTTTSLDSAISR